MYEKTGFFKSIGYSISKFSFANEIIEVQRGGKYIVLLSLLIALLSTAVLTFDLFALGTVKKMSDEIIRSIPDFELKGGRLYIDIDEPIIIEGDSLIVIDNLNDESIMDSYSGFAGQRMYINTDYFVLHKGNAEPTKIHFSSLDYNLSREQLPKLINVIAIIVIVIYFIGAFLGCCIKAIFMALIVSVIGLLINKLMRTSLRFREIRRLSAYAVTPVFLIQVVLKDMPIIINCLIMSVYLFLYIKAIRDNEYDNYNNNDDYGEDSGSHDYYG